MVMLLGVGGCLRGERDGERVVGGGGEAGDGAKAVEGVPAELRTGTPYQFRPRRLRIYPLTRVERDEQGARVVCHVELMDRWGDTTKWVGLLRVQMYETDPGIDPGLERQVLEWVVDLGDAEQNAALYDPSTRTYRLNLRDLPAWVEKALPRTPGGERLNRLRLVASLRFVDRDGTVREVRDEAVVRF